MKLFNIFDRWGNKIGEVYEVGDPLEGLGGFLGAFITLIIGAGAVLIWPIFFNLLFHDFTTEYERSCGIVQLTSIVVTLAADGYFEYKAEKFTFIGTWSGMVTACTLLPGIISWLYCYLHGEKEFSLLLASFFICFLLSIGGGLIGTITVLIARRIKFSK